MKKIIILFLMFIPFYSFAQYGETIRTGRPGQAIGGFTLGKSVFQIQTGYTFNQIENDFSEIFRTTNTTVLRLGVTERFELSGVVNWQTEELTDGINDVSIGGISNTQIGGRINLSQNQGWIPTIGLQARVLLKFQSTQYKRDDLGSKFILATGNKINDKMAIVTNWGITWAGNDQNPSSFYVINTSYSINDKFGTFVEVYGDLDEFSTHFDTGLSYLVNKDFQLDFSTGWQGKDDISDWFIDFGLSWRLDWRNKI